MLDSESKKRLIDKNRAVRAQNKRELKPDRSDPHRRCKQGEALERKEIEFTKAQQIAAIGSFTVDLATGEQEWSDQVFRMLGLAPGAIPATLEAFVERVHSEDRALLVEKSNDAFTGAEDLDHQYRIVRQDGQIRFVHTQTNTEYGQNEKPLRLYGFTQDITERKRTEEALRESESRFRSLSEAAFEGIVFSENGVLVDANEAFARMYQCSLGEVMGRPVMELVAPEHRELVAENIRSGHEGVYEHKGIRKDGSLIDLEIRGRPVIYKGREMRMTALRDITKRKQAELALQESEERLKVLFECAPDGIYLNDLSGNFVDGNKAAEELVGYAREELIGKNFAEAGLLSQEDTERAAARLQKTAAGEAVGPEQFTLKRKDGSEIEVEISTFPATIKGQIFSLGVARDITDRKRTEAALANERLLSEEYISSLPGLFYVFDEQHFVKWNSVWESVTGYSNEELAGKYGTDFFEGEDRTLIAERMQKVFLEGAAEAEAELVTKDGRRIPYYFSGLRKEFHGRPHLVGLGIDITERKRAEEALRESEFYLRKSQEVSNTGSYVYDIANDSLTASDVLNNLWGIRDDTKKDAKRWVSILHPDDREEMTDYLLNHVIGCGNAFDREYRLINQETKETVWVHGRGELEFDDSGAPIRMVGTIADITERKQAEEALRESEERLKILFESAPDAYYIHDLEGRFVDGNRAALELVGYRKEEAVGKSYFELGMIAEADISKSSAALADNRDGKPAGPLELTVNRKDGSKVIVETRSYPVDIAGETLILGIARNITERRKTVEALRQSENKFRTIFETAANLIGLVDKEGIIVDCNSRVKEFLGYDKDEIVGQSIAKIIHPDYLEKADGALREMALGGDSQDEEFQMVHKNGTLIDVSINASVLRDENGEFARILCVINDITERKLARQKLVEYSEQLKSLASQLSLTEERERHRLATLLHDHIGQSLVFSKLKLDQIRKSVSSEELVEAMDEVCNWIGNVIADTRTLTFDLSWPILYELGFEAAVAEWLSDEIEQKHGIEARFENDKQPKPMDDDIRAVLFRNVRELLTNVAKHAKARRVKVSLSRVDGNIRVTVEDDGMGFDPVEVTSRAARRAEFGLFSIRERLSQLGGSIEIASAPGQGSKISMTAPLKKTQTDNAPQNV